MGAERVSVRRVAAIESAMSIVVLFNSGLVGKAWFVNPVLRFEKSPSNTHAFTNQLG